MKTHKPIGGAILLSLTALLHFGVGAAVAVEVVVDNRDPGFSLLSGSWNTGSSPTPWGADYRWRATVTGTPTGEAEWRPVLPVTGVYEVFIWYVQGSNRATNAPYTVECAGSPVNVQVNQQVNGSQWFSLGTYTFNAGTGGRVCLNNVANGAVVIADAVRFVLTGEAGLNADFDGDLDVDVADFAFFQACVTGAGRTTMLSACTGVDLDSDTDVDQDDFGLFQCCMSGVNVAAEPACTAGPIPARAGGAATGSAFVQEVWSMAKSAREQRVLAEMTAGNVPAFLRKFVPVTVTATINGTLHTATYYVMPDYLAVGSDADFVRFPTGPLTAQSIGDLFQCTLPTRKMVNDIWSAALCKLAPHPFSPTSYTIDSVEVFNLSNTAIEQQRAAAACPLGMLIAGIKKDVVVTAQLATRPGKVAIYGWHQLNGQPIQPLYLGHEITYMDYSHGIRLVRNVMLVDGVPTTISALLKDPVLCALISDEGVVNDPRYH